jgi:hypothetical protein
MRAVLPPPPPPLPPLPPPPRPLLLLLPLLLLFLLLLLLPLVLLPPSSPHALPRKARAVRDPSISALMLRRRGVCVCWCLTLPPPPPDCAAGEGYRQRPHPGCASDPGDLHVWGQPHWHQQLPGSLPAARPGSHQRGAHGGCLCVCMVAGGWMVSRVGGRRAFYQRFEPFLPARCGMVSFVNARLLQVKFTPHFELTR